MQGWGFSVSNSHSTHYLPQFRQCTSHPLGISKGGAPGVLRPRCKMDSGFSLLLLVMLLVLHALSFSSRLAGQRHPTRMKFERYEGVRSVAAKDQSTLPKRSEGQSF